MNGFNHLKAIKPLQGDNLLLTTKFPGISGTIKCQTQNWEVACSNQAFFQAFFLLLGNSSKNSMLNWVFKLNLLFICFWKTQVIKFYENMKLQSQPPASKAH